MTAIDHGRRSFLSGRGLETAPPVRPPWSSEESIDRACTGCGACAEACPQRIIRLGAAGYPEIAFAQACTFCGACARACPEPVFDDAARPAFAHVASITGACFARRDIHCHACADACPEAAIRLRPRLGGPPLPEVAAQPCTGCGACVAVCPATAIVPRPMETLDV